jgi:hypothetical protein
MDLVDFPTSLTYVGNVRRRYQYGIFDWLDLASNVKDSKANAHGGKFRERT